MIPLRRIGPILVAILFITPVVAWRLIPAPDFAANGNRTTCLQQARATADVPNEANAPTDLAFSYTATDERVASGTMDKDSSYAFWIEQYRSVLNECLYENGRAKFYATHASWTPSVLKARLAERF